MSALHHCIVIGDPTRGARVQVRPLRRSRRRLVRHGWRLSVDRTGDDAAAVVRRLRKAATRCVAVQVHWSLSTPQVLDLLARVRREAGEARLVFLDFYDGVTSPHFAVLPVVDAYLKKQLPCDPDDLAASPASGGRIGAYFRDLFGLPPVEGDAADDGTLAVTREHADQLILGWNVGADWFDSPALFGGRLRRLLGGVRTSRPLASRGIDVHCRVGLADHGYEDWYRLHRRSVVARLETLGGGYRTITGLSGKGVGPGVPRRQFEAELRDSRVCVSPFGYGEVCYRDFEAVAAGCLLAKPDMGHLRTAPDLYVPHETYIPFRWDATDLPAALEPYLADPARAARVAANARRALVAYLQRQAWTEPFLQAMDGSPRSSRPPPATK